MEIRWSSRIGFLGATACAFILFALVAIPSDGSDLDRQRSMAAVESAILHMPSQATRVAVSDEKRAEMKKHAVSGASLVNTKMSPDMEPSSQIADLIGSSGSTVPETNKTTGEQITGIDPVTGKRIDTGDMPSFIFPILLAMGGTVVMVAVFTYMCCFKSDAKPENKRAAPAPAKP